MLRELTFEIYLNIFPTKFEDYEIIETFKSSLRKEGSEFFADFIHKVKLPEKPKYYILKGVTMNKREYPKWEKEVNHSNLFSLFNIQLSLMVSLEHPNIVNHIIWFKKNILIKR